MGLIQTMAVADSVGNCRMDVFEDPVTNVVTAAFELPGVSQDKITIGVYENRLTISGEVASFFGENCGYILRERRTGPFVRTLVLPTNIPVSHKRPFPITDASLISCDCGF